MKRTPIIEADGTRKGGPQLIGYSQDLSDEEYEKRFGKYIDDFHYQLDPMDEPKKGKHYIIELREGSGLYNDGHIYDYKGIKKLMKRYDELENNYRVYQID